MIDSLESIIEESLHIVSIIVIFSILIKLATFPFHWWIADIYDGFWSPLLLIYITVVKLGLFLFLFKLVLNLFYAISFAYSYYFVFIGTGSILIGAIGAITQVKIKRFLGFSSISHAGYIILGLGSYHINGYIAGFLYLILYSMISLSFFGCLLNINHMVTGKNIVFFNQLYSLSILNKEWSINLFIIVGTMASMPPFSSFFTKIYVYSIYMDNKTELVVWVLLCSSVLTLYNYLNLIQQWMFLRVYDLRSLYIFDAKYPIRYLLCFFSFFYLVGWGNFSGWYIISKEALLTCAFPLSYFN